MRTILNLDEDVLAVARALAERKGCSLGSAVSELARRDFKGIGAVEEDRGFPVFNVDEGAAPITNENLYGALDDWP